MLFFVAAGPVGALLGLMELRRRRYEPIVAAGCIAWGLASGAALLIAGMRFWRLHGSGQATDYIFDTHEGAWALTAWGSIGVALSIFGCIRYRRRRQMPQGLNRH